MSYCGESSSSGASDITSSSNSTEVSSTSYSVFQSSYGKKPKCIICNKRTDDIITLGEFIYHEPIHIHYFCLLTASYIPQARNDFKEIGGFRYVDILAGLKKFKLNQCYVCQRKSAAIKCCVEGCGNFWHFPCGVISNSLSLFTDDFRSYCCNHVPDPNKGKKVLNELQPCLACYSPIGNYNPVRTIISSCCVDEEDYMIRFIHRRCLLKYARNAGYAAMCITCDKIKVKRVWQEEMRKKGVYIPMQEAIWERDGSFKDHYKNVCEDPACEDVTNKREVFTCYICGCRPRHLSCAGVEKHQEYHCIECFDQSFVQRVPF